MESRAFALVAAALLAGVELAVAAPAPSASGSEPAAYRIEVSPASVAPGETVEVRLLLEPAAGIKINKYPKIRLKIPAAPGVVGEAEGSVGSDAAPPPDQLESNYFKSLDPVRATVRVVDTAHAGTHEVEGKLSYYYCVASSGYCAPAKVPVKFPIRVR